MSIPTDLEQYSQRLIDFCDSLSASAYVNFHRLFLMRVVKSNPSKMMLDMYVVWLNDLLTGSRKNVASVRKNTDVGFISLVKSYIDPRLFKNEEEMKHQHPNTVKVLSFIEALMLHMDDMPAREHWQIHQQFLKGNHQPIVDYYGKVSDEAKRMESSLQDYHITTYKPFDMPTDEELDMMSILDLLLNDE